MVPGYGGSVLGGLGSTPPLPDARTPTFPKVLGKRLRAAMSQCVRMKFQYDGVKMGQEAAIGAQEIFKILHKKANLLFPRSLSLEVIKNCSTDWISFICLVSC